MTEKEIEEHFIEALRTYTNLTVDALNAVVTTIPYSRFHKGAILLNQGDAVKDTYYLIKGCVKQSSVNQKGKESIIELYTDKMAISTFGYADEAGASSFSLVCLEPSILVACSEELVKATVDENATYGHLVDFFVRKQFTDTQRQLTSFKQLSPEERFGWLMDERPMLLKRVQQHILASYIDISPESFSRFKKRLNERGGRDAV